MVHLFVKFILIKDFQRALLETVNPGSKKIYVLNTDFRHKHELLAHCFHAVAQSRSIND